MHAFDHRSGKTLDIHGAKIYFEVQGEASDPPLILSHGGLGTIEDFNAVLPLLARQFRVIGIDTRGHGRSTLGTSPLTYERLQWDIDSVASHLGLQHFDMMAFSDGGIAALRLATGKGSRIGKLVAVGARWELKSDEPARELLAGVTAESWRRKFPETAEAYLALNPEPDFDTLVQATVKMWLDTGATGYPGWTVRSISRPLLVVRGDEDPIVSRSNAFDLAEQVPKAKLFSVPFAEHEVHRQKPALLMDIVNEFLAD